MGGKLRVRYRKDEEPHILLDFAVTTRERAATYESESNEILLDTDTLPADFFSHWREYEIKDGKLVWSSVLHAENK